MTPMKSPLKKLNVKTMTHAGTALVALTATGILFLTMWFIMKTLGEVAVAQTSNGTAQLRIEGVSTPLLEKAMTFRDEKSSDARALGPNLPNPFARPPAPASPAPQPPAAPEETTTPEQPAAPPAQ